MDANDKSFFERLVGGKSEPQPEPYEIELARSNSGILSSAKPHTRTKRNDADWAQGEPEGQLTVDVYQTADDIVVESAIAGIRPDDLDITVTTDSISIRGAREHEKLVSDEDYLYQECYWGRFGRSIILPQEVDPENADVRFKNGILTVRLPKANRKKTRKLKVNID
ncbi:MAG TPA: Hsp20/alpha crystallin family protein [Candidatus Paceibacterota bacterium]|nr:Hsp20/alpha crystallin family protein [Candidatus Paceibacterota bacterium]